MKHKSLLIFPLLSFLFPAHSHGSVLDYPEHSVLSEGHWVKMAVETTAIHRISYQKLRELGFDSPANVSVFGRGGEMMPLDFTDSSGNVIIDTDLPQCAVWHEDGWIYFYAVGPLSHHWQSNGSLSTDGAFMNGGKNIYSNLGYYFLTDSAAPLLMEASAAVPDAPTVEVGYDFVDHELDLAHNNSASGQLFWGENLLPTPQGGTLSWQTVPTNPVIPGAGAMQCVMYAGANEGGDLFFGTTDGTMVEHKASIQSSSLFEPQRTSLGNVTLGSSQAPVVEVTYSSKRPDDAEETPLAALDHWTLTYPCSVPTLTDAAGVNLAQTRFTPANNDLSLSGRFTMVGFNQLLAFDVSDPRHVRRIHTSADGHGNTVVTYESDGPFPPLVIVDPSRQVSQPSFSQPGCGPIKCSDLHSLAAEGVELLIITTPSWHPYAEEIADLHRRHDGISVAVALADDIYNEFSGGVPDPMAYRNLTRMLYDAEGAPLKNVLMMGSFSGDFRGITTGVVPEEALIAFQSSYQTKTKGAPSVLSFVGMMDNCNSNILFERRKVQVGVGVLPIYFNRDAETIVDKIERYLSDTSMAYRLNESLAIGGIGDKHTHGKQSKELSEYIAKITDNRFVASTLVVDSYGFAEARKTMLQLLNRGKMLVSYFGHGSMRMLGKETDFFHSPDVARLSNSNLAFMLYAACEISDIDHGRRGIGDAMITATPHGMIGGLMASRSTWSGQNMDFLKVFHNHLFRTGPYLYNPVLPEPITIGQAFARSLSYSTYANELPYDLVCDPAIVIPMPLRSISAVVPESLQSGATVALSGSVLNSEGDPDSEYSGEVVVKLMEPEFSMMCAELATGAGKNGASFEVPYSDRVSTIASAPVVNGNFSVKLPVSRSLGRDKTEDCRIVISAYDPSTKTGAGSVHPVAVCPREPGIADATDAAPVIETLEYSDSDCTLLVTVSDDFALPLSSRGIEEPFSVTIDGYRHPSLHATTAIVEHDSQRISRTIPVDYLDPGQHSARIEVADDAGNRTVAEIGFTIGGSSAPYSLELQSNIAATEARFHLLGDIPSKAELRVADAHGATVWSTPLAPGSREAVWDLSAHGGGKVATGLYRAWIVETSLGSCNTQSATVIVPVP